MPRIFLSVCCVLFCLGCTGTDMVYYSPEDLAKMNNGDDTDGDADSDEPSVCYGEQSFISRVSFPQDEEPALIWSWASGSKSAGEYGPGQEFVDATEYSDHRILLVSRERKLNPEGNIVLVWQESDGTPQETANVGMVENADSRSAAVIQPLGAKVVDHFEDDDSYPIERLLLWGTIQPRLDNDCTANQVTVSFKHKGERFAVDVADRRQILFVLAFDMENILVDARFVTLTDADDAPIHAVAVSGAALAYCRKTQFREISFESGASDWPIDLAAKLPADIDFNCTGVVSPTDYYRANYHIVADVNNPGDGVEVNLYPDGSAVQAVSLGSGNAVVVYELEASTSPVWRSPVGNWTLAVEPYTGVFVVRSSQRFPGETTFKVGNGGFYIGRVEDVLNDNYEGMVYAAGNLPNGYSVKLKLAGFLYGVTAGEYAVALIGEGVDEGLTRIHSDASLEEMRNTGSRFGWLLSTRSDSLLHFNQYAFSRLEMNFDGLLLSAEIESLYVFGRVSDGIDMDPTYDNEQLLETQEVDCDLLPADPVPAACE